MIKTPIKNVEQLKDIKSIGDTIRRKLQEYIDTGTLAVLEKAKTNPIFIFTEVMVLVLKKLKN